MKSSVSSIRILFDVLESTLKGSGRKDDVDDSNEELCKLAVSYSLPTFLKSFLEVNR